jgi:hypothetical protein
LAMGQVAWCKLMLFGLLGSYGTLEETQYFFFCFNQKPNSLPIDPLDCGGLPNTKSYMYEPVLASYWVLTSVGRFSLFFCENCPISVLSWCYKNLLDSLIYKFFWAGENWWGYQI